MCLTLIGGMDRLILEYIATASAGGHSLRCLSRNERNFVEKIGNPDTLIIFTNKISHEAKRKALKHAHSKKIPVRLVHSCGLSTLIECLAQASGQ